MSLEKNHPAFTDLARESVYYVTASEVMAEAWRLAKLIASEYSISPKLLLPAAMRKVWAQVPAKIRLFDAYESRQLLSILGFKFNKENKAWEKVMCLGEFKNPQPVRYGRGFKSDTEIKRAYNYKHSVTFI